MRYTLLALLFGSQLAINPFLTTDVFEFPKLLVLYVGTGVFTLVNIVDLSRWNSLPKEIRNHTLEFGFLSLFLLAQILAFAFSTNRAISLTGASDRFQGLITQIHYLLLLLNTAYVFARYPHASEKIFHQMPLVLIILCVLALLPYLLPLTSPFILFTPAFFSGRVYGTFGNPNYLAASIITLLPFLFYGRGINPKTAGGNLKGMSMPSLRGGELGRVGVLTLALVTLFLTGSRSAWVASLAGFLIIGILEFLSERKLQKLVIASSIAVVLLAVSSFKSSLFPSTELFERLRLDTPTSTSLQTRLFLWKGGMALALTRPITGYGQDMIKGNIEPYLPVYLKENETFFIDRTHSELIDVFVTTGLLGLIGYVGFFGLILWNGVRMFFHPSFLALLTLLLFHMVNFSTVSSNVLLFFLAGSLLTHSTSLDQYQNAGENTEGTHLSCNALPPPLSYALDA